MRLSLLIHFHEIFLLNFCLFVFVFHQVALVYGQMNEPPGARARVALTGLTEALAAEGKPHRIRVNGVAPGAVDTAMLRQAAPHLRTRTTPAEVAKIIVFLCDPAESGCMTGATVLINSNE